MENLQELKNLIDLGVKQYTLFKDGQTAIAALVNLESETLRVQQVYQQACDDLAAKEQECADAKSQMDYELEAHRVSIDTQKQALIDELENMKTDAQEQISERHTTLDELRDKISEAESELAVVKSKKDSTSSTVTQLQDKLDNLKEQIKQLVK